MLSESSQKSVNDFKLFLFALQITFLTFEGVDTNIKLAFQANIIQSFHLILSYQNKDA